MNNRVIETVSFKLANGVSDTDFLATLPPVNAFISSCDGFISRRLSKGEDGVWLDHVEWTSLAKAKEASDRFMQQDGCGPFLGAMDMPSVTMSHNELQMSLG